MPRSAAPRPRSPRLVSPLPRPIAQCAPNAQSMRVRDCRRGSAHRPDIAPPTRRSGTVRPLSKPSVLGHRSARVLTSRSPTMRGDAVESGRAFWASGPAALNRGGPRNSTWTDSPRGQELVGSHGFARHDQSRPESEPSALDRLATNAVTSSREGCPHPMQKGCPAGSAYT
jgi:hypothetical protein